MKKVSSQQLEPSRTCFTDICYDALTYHPGETAKLEVERKLKILIMTKGHVVIPADILLTGFNYFPFLEQFPDLITLGIVLPALPASSASFEDFSHRPDPMFPDGISLNKAPHSPVNRACAFLDASATVIAYDPFEAARWMHRSLIHQLTQPDTLFASLFPGISWQARTEMAEAISEKLYLSRYTTPSLINYSFRDKFGINEEEWKQFYFFLYDLDYIAATRAVDCTGVLPQENFAISKTADIERPGYSEIWFFWKLLVQIYADMAGTHFTVEALDALTLQDVLAIRDRIMGVAFRRSYNRLLELSKTRVNVLDPEGLLLTLEEVNDLITQMEATFFNELKRELKARRRQEALYDLTKGTYSVATLLIPILGSIDGDARPFAHFFRAIFGRSKVEDLEQYIEPKILKAKQKAVNLSYQMKGEETVLIDFVDALHNLSWEQASGQLKKKMFQ